MSHIVDGSAFSEERQVAALLGNPATYGEDVEKVDVIETHIARVFLAGEDVFKVKKRVRLPFVDFSTIESRRSASIREVEVNRQHAPQIYLGLIPIVRTRSGELALGGEGEVLDWAVHMRRFPEADVLINRIQHAPLSDELARALAEMVAAYHRDSVIDAGSNGEWAFGPIVRQLTAALAQSGEPGSVFVERMAREFERVAPLLIERAKAGCIRRCHGDLHLGNIVLINGAPVAFDALEFSEALATIDVLYDLAFLLMDLDFRGARHAANIALNDYVGTAPVGNEIEGLSTLPLFLAARAGVRAIVSIARSEQLDAAEKEACHAHARRYLEFGCGYLAPPHPVLVAVGGLSGTGKSTLAAKLAPFLGAAPGALHLRSDVERKRLFGVPETQRLDRQHYRIGIAQRVYSILEQKGRSALAAGHSVIVDAVFAKPEERADIERIAQACGVAFVGLWLDAPAPTLIARVEQRHGDASDADRRVVKEQLSYDLGEISWHRVDAAGSAEEAYENARSVPALAPLMLETSEMR
jgi:aminoglycoside phosphotransferase family enzyme/predicted kinase